MLKRMLTIAGFDPSSGAGVTADLAVFAAHGCFGTACVTAFTVQSTLGVRSVHVVEPRVVTETLECLWDDVPADGVKIGMLATPGNVDAVAEFLERVRTAGWAGPVVLDPVMRASSGQELLSCEGIERLKDRLLPLVNWVTPNLAELTELSGVEVRDREGMERGAEEVRVMFPGLGVAATGGHLANAADDLVIAADGAKKWIRGKRIASRSTHGTGCAFSSAMLCGLVEGSSGEEAVRQAKEFVAEAIRRAQPMGRGIGPMNLWWPLRR